MSACDGKVGGVDLNSDTDTRPPSCEPDDFNSLTQTRPAQLGIVVEDTICPRADQDFWQLTSIGGDKQLLSVDLVYEKLSNVELRADVWGPRGRCMPNALTPCTTNEQCAPSFDFCDTARGGCRMAASPVCFADTNCATGESCYGTNTAIEQLGSVRIPATSVLQHRLTANYAAFAQGTYTVVVYDHAEREEEPVDEYSLTVTTQSDPDTNEPNDLVNLATPLTHNVGVEGAMSYVDDVDWFVIQPVSALPAVVRVNLTYSGNAVIAPTWTVVQGGFQYIGPNAKTESSGGTALRRQQAAIVTPAAAPVYIRVQNGSTATNTTDRYNLTVEIADDPEEGATRNDDIANATALTSTTATSGPNGTQVVNYTDRHLVALNDTDWYRIPRAGPAENTLLYFRNTAAANAPYSLVLQMYRETATACSPTNQCSQGRPCSPEGVCLDLMAQRPAPDGPGDPQQGGLSPNYLETQLPMFDDVSYVRVVNNAATTLDVPGYDFDKTSPYTLLIRHKLEPDSGDRNTPDNRFLSRPFDADEGDFAPMYRNVTAGSTVVPGSNGQPMAVARPATNVSGTACTDVNLDLFDGRGAALAGDHTIAVTATGGTVQRNCGDATASPFASTGATTTIGVVSAGGAVTLTTTVDGTGSVQSYLPTSGALNFRSSVPNQPAARGVAEGSASQVVRIILPATAGPGGVPLTLAMSAGGVLCANADVGNPTLCQYTAGNTCSPTTPSASCQVTIPQGQQVYDIRATFPAPGAPQTLTVNGGAKFQWVVYGAGSIVTNGPTTIQGYLSYDGDQDFFQIVPSNVGPGGVTIRVTFPASRVDIRAQATRGGGGAGVGRTQDVCEDGCGAGTCNTQRQTCDQPGTPLSAGPEATTPECVYTSASGATPIRVWVNDTNSNDWDETNMYSIEVDYAEGCPAICPAAACN